MSRLVPQTGRGVTHLTENGLTTRYLDISSAYRNRYQYPDSCNFVVQVNNNNNSQSNPVGSNDPVALGFPYDAGLLSGGSTNTQFALSVDSSNILNFYRGSYINIGTYYGLITAYNQITQVVTVSTPIPGPPPPALTPYTIRKQLPLPLDLVPNYQDATIVATPLNVFEPGPLGQAKAGTDPFSLNNKFVLFQGANFPDTAQWGYLDYIIGTAPYQYRVRNPDNAVTFGPIPAGQTYEIFNFSYDNVRPLKYQGTDLIQTPICELRLVSLILPALPLADGYGGYISDYSHIYISIQSAKAGTYSNPLISNSPASSIALFQIPITFLFNPEKKFNSLIFTGMKQKVFFRESDDMLVQILLPDGQILKYEQPSTLTFFPNYRFPIPSNPLNEIQVNLEVTRLG